MTPGQRCDEIIRLIDEGLSGAARTGPVAATPHPLGAPAPRVHERPLAAATATGAPRS